MPENENFHPPSTLLQIAGVLSSITHATNEILGGNPGLVAEVQNLYRSFLSSPTTIKLLGFDPTSPPKTTPLPDPLRKEILTMKESITTLSKVVQSLQPKTGASKPPTNPITPPTPTSAPRAKGQNPWEIPPSDLRLPSRSSSSPFRSCRHGKRTDRP